MSELQITFTNPDERVDRLTTELGLEKEANERLRRTVELLKAMLPKCEKCYGNGMFFAGFANGECKACGGLGVVKP